jgi:hypothetical protein
MMLADPEEGYAHLVRKERLCEDVAEDLRLGKEGPVRARRHIAEGVQSEFEALYHAELLPASARATLGGGGMRGPRVQSMIYPRY